MPRASRREAAFAAAAYVLLAIAYWWPLPLRAADAAIAHPFGDPLLNAWTLAWDARHLLHGFSGYWDGLFFHPYPDTVAYSEHLLGIAVFTAPLQWFTGNAVLVLNVATLTGRPGGSRQAFATLAKSCLVDLTRAQAEEWAGRGIRFNAIAPETALGEPGPRLSGESDVASLALYLASDKGKALSGCVFEAA